MGADYTLRDLETCPNNEAGHEPDWCGLAYGEVSAAGVVVDVPCRWCGQSGSFTLGAADVEVQW